MPLRLSRTAAALLLALAGAGCIVVPQTREVYDADCRVLTRQVTLEVAVVGGLHSCAGDACLAMLVSAGVVTAASAVVSGSIALVGNVAYWFERQGRCVGPARPAGVPAAGPASAASAARPASGAA